MKKLFLLFFSLVLFISLLTPSQVNGQTDKTVLLRQIEILKHEIQVLKMLITNMLSDQPVSAGSYLAVNLNNNSVVLEKNSNQSYPIASITKLMNALIVKENIDNNQTIVLTEKMLEPAGQSPCLYLGLKITAEKLLKASLIQSTNDAAESLAYFIDKDEFLLLMNEKAQQIGMKNTVFHDLHGLSPKNSSTAADLAELVKYVYQNYPEILTITRDNNFWLAVSFNKFNSF
jgi:serine-type D-Ala-D-Ala carboxypeptidase (penicillin-binding protein 5/6)